MAKQRRDVSRHFIVLTPYRLGQTIWTTLPIGPRGLPSQMRTLLFFRRGCTLTIANPRDASVLSGNNMYNEVLGVHACTEAKAHVTKTPVE